MRHSKLLSYLRYAFTKQKESGEMVSIMNWLPCTPGNWVLLSGVQVLDMVWEMHTYLFTNIALMLSRDVQILGERC